MVFNSYIEKAYVLAALEDASMNEKEYGTKGCQFIKDFINRYRVLQKGVEI